MGSGTRKGGRGKMSVGCPLIAVHGGGHRRVLVDVVGIILILGTHCSSWFVIIVVRASCCMHPLSCVSISVGVRCHLHLLMLVVPSSSIVRCSKGEVGGAKRPEGDQRGGFMSVRWVIIVVVGLLT